ncbi:MJ0042-type zinc finger domain-containing protein [Neisseria montereyensis]|uniref:MJ0042 family finger-like domain n=1 Tax=Neisseria montereyensis TaxID=2973938 RepID=A0ABT2FE99_9NEIS|nr:MJ0042-type zinc finger domain-containing protein [Neisseria montereyensis]MCS4534523.1 hypothetical protein [Neisseria montereyensis]
MPVCTCPHCKTRLWVNNTQFNVAQGFVVCSKCDGLFQARGHITAMPDEPEPTDLPNALTDTKLIHALGPKVRAKKVLSKNEIAELLDNMHSGDEAKLAEFSLSEQEHEVDAAFANVSAESSPESVVPPAPVAAPPAKESVNWTLATLIALTVLIMQLFYIILLN